MIDWQRWPRLPPFPIFAIGISLFSLMRNEIMLLVLITAWKHAREERQTPLCSIVYRGPDPRGRYFWYTAKLLLFSRIIPAENNTPSFNMEKNTVWFFFPPKDKSDTDGFWLITSRLTHREFPRFDTHRVSILTFIIRELIRKLPSCRKDGDGSLSSPPSFPLFPLFECLSQYWLRALGMQTRSVYSRRAWGHGFCHKKNKIFFCQNVVIHIYLGNSK